MSDLLKLISLLYQIGVKLWNLKNSELTMEEGLMILSKILDLLNESPEKVSEVFTKMAE